MTDDPRLDPPTDSTDPQQPKQAPDYEAKFKGLQRVNQELQNTMKTQGEQLQMLTQTLTSFMEKVTPDDAPASDQPATLQESLDALVGRMERMETDLRQKEISNQKLRMLGETPELLQFADSIPTVEDPTQQQEAIANFAERLNAFVANRKPPTPDSPPTSKPPRPPAPTDPKLQAADAYKAYSEAVINGKPESEIAQLRNEYLKVADVHLSGFGWNYTES